MFIDLPYSTPLAVVVALASAALRWWWGRTLAPQVDDAAFPERLAAHRQRSGQSFGVALALLLVLFTHTLFWSLPLLILSCAAASFRFRRMIYRETWGFGAYLSFHTRTIVAVFGFWLLLAGMPALVLLAGSRDWVAALLAGGLLALWNDRYPEILRFLTRAAPIDNPDLIARFTTVAQRSTAAMPRFERVVLGGGSMANAIALPSVRRSSVIFTDTLLSRLDEDEIVAICGHEIAHLEHYNPELLRRRNAGNVALIAGSVLTVVAAHAIEPSWISLTVVWPCVVVVAMGWRARHRQLHETESDLRAVALTGNPEALASGLTKIHAYAHLPRRVAAQVEQHATHPSLARRIKAIRAAAPAAVAPMPPLSATFVAADGQTQVTFGNERLEWREGDVALHTFSYPHLSELRLEASPHRPTRLLAVELGGRRWEMTLGSGDIARAQAALDLIDSQLAEPTAPPAARAAWQRALTLIAVTAAIVSGQLATMIVALVAVFRPAAPLLAAAGAAMIAGGGLALRQPDWPGLEMQAYGSLALVCAGAFLLWSAWASRDIAPPATVTRFVALLGVLSALALLSVFIGGTGIVRMHQAARMTTAVVVWPMALAAALACYPGWRARTIALGATIAGVTMAAIGSLPFLDRFGNDPLLLQAGPLEQVHFSAAPAAEFALPFYAMDVRLSPGGASIAAHDAYRNRGRNDGSLTFEVGRLGHQFASVAAEEVVFVDDERVLTLHQNHQGTEIVERLVTQPDVPVWQHRIPGLFDARLTVDRQAGRWRLLGWDAEERIVRARGVIGSTDVETTRWSSPIDRKIWTTSVAVSEDNALVVETRYDLGGLEMLSVRTFAAVLNPGASVSRLWHVGQNSQKDLGLSHIATDCSAELILNERLVCSAFDGTRTRIVALDPATGERSAIGVMDGRFAGDEHPPAGWLTGWRDSTPVALRLDTRQIVTVPRQYGLVGFAASDRLLATVSVDGTKSKLRLYPLPM